MFVLFLVPSIWCCFYEISGINVTLLSIFCSDTNDEVVKPPNCAELAFSSWHTYEDGLPEVFVEVYR